MSDRIVRFPKEIDDRLQEAAKDAGIPAEQFISDFAVSAIDALWDYQEMVGEIEDHLNLKMPVEHRDSLRVIMDKWLLDPKARSRNPDPYQECARLAGEFRGNRDEEARKIIVAKYAEAFRKEFDPNWSPVPDEMLPDEFMPKEWHDFLREFHERTEAEN